jgi:ABC-type multidrug transport system ATPase subunit/ABC-type uncharacterized transport system permease subunit
MLEVVNICVRESLILFPLVLGVGLLYTHIRLLDVSVDGIAIASGIVCALVWTASKSYAFSIVSAIICGVLCSWIVCIMVSKLSVIPIMAGLIFSLAIRSISILIVGESITLPETKLLPGFTTISWWLIVLTILIAVGSYQFFFTRLGGEIRAYGNNPLFRSSYSPFLMHMTIYGFAGGLYGLSSSIYVHSQGLAGSGGGFEFLILALCSYLSIDRFVAILQYTFYHARRQESKTVVISSHTGRTLADLIQSPPIKAFVGIVFFQHLVFLTILHSPNPSIWKLIMSLILGCSLIRIPWLSLSRKQLRWIPITRDESEEPIEEKIEIECLSKSYDLGIEKRRVFKQMNCSFGQGISILRGPNGSGKSTLLELLNGTLPCDSGSIIFNGKNVTILPPFQRPVFLIRQNPFHSLAGDLSVIENLALTEPRDNSFLGSFLSEARTLNNLFDLLSQFGIPPLEPKDSSFWYKPAVTLSGGQATCVAFYMALLSDKKIIMADEPSTGLDLENFDRLILILNALKKQHIVVVTTHDHRLDSLDATHYLIQNLTVIPDGVRNGA